MAVSIGHDTGVYIGTMFCLGPDASVEIGSYGTLAGPILSTNSRITIGDHALISFQVVLAGNPAPAPFGALARALDERTDTEIHIGENVWIGACAVVLGGASIGDNAIIGAGAVVDFEVPTNAIVAGNPARIVSRADQRALLP